MTTTARAAAAAALLYGGAAGGGAASPRMMMLDHAESPADCVTAAAAAAAFRHQLLAATAAVAARTSGYMAPAAVRPLPTSPTAATTSPSSDVDHHATVDSTDYDSASFKQLNTGKQKYLCVLGNTSFCKVSCLVWANVMSEDHRPQTMTH